VDFRKTCLRLSIRSMSTSFWKSDGLEKKASRFFLLSSYSHSTKYSRWCFRFSTNTIGAACSPVVQLEESSEPRRRSLYLILTDDLDITSNSNLPTARTGGTREDESSFDKPLPKLK